MGTLIVKVTAECEGLISALPRDGEWELVSENYNDDGSGVVTIDFYGDDLSASAKQALDTHDGIITYEIIDTPERRVNNQGFPIDMSEELLETYRDL